MILSVDCDCEDFKNPTAENKEEIDDIMNITSCRVLWLY